MSTNLPNKSSSRSGRFKKKLVSQEQLQVEAPYISKLTKPLSDSFDRKELSPSEFCALYIIHILNYRYPGSWPGAKRATPLVEEHQLNRPILDYAQFFEPNVQRRLGQFKSIGDIFNYFSLQSTPLTVNRSILKWSTGDYGLELMFRIPLPGEVLNQQKRGQRCVSMILDEEKSSQYILGERDSLGFTMHDLIHADHFYHENKCFEGQLGFYGLLDFTYQRGDFKEFMMNKLFVHEFEYLISDMNAYPIHLMKCLKSALLHYHNKGSDFFNSWIETLDLNSNEKLALLKLNTPDYQSNLDAELLNVLNRFRYSAT
jgi:hypothetical protein